MRAASVRRAGASGALPALLWTAVALGAIVGGAALAQEPVWALDAALVTAGVGAFAWRPEAALLVVLVVAFRSSPLVELLTLTGGGVVLLARARPLPGPAVWLPLLALVAFSVWRLRLSPSPADITMPLTIPLLGVEYLPRVSEQFASWCRLAYAATVFCLAAWVVRDVTGLRRLTAAIMVGAVVPVFVGLKEIATDEFTLRGGFKAVDGPFNFPNQYAFYLLGVILLGMAAMTQARTVRWRVGLGLLLAGACVCLFFTYTRSSWLGLALGFVLYGLLRDRRWLLVVALVIAATVFFVPSSVERIEGRFEGVINVHTGLESNSWTWRTGQWERMFRYGKDHPVAGSGFRSYEELTVREFGALDPHYGTVVHSGGQNILHGFSAHNDYMRLFVELGVVGLGLWLLTIAGMLRVSLASRRIPGAGPYAIAALGIVASFALVSAADNLMAYTSAILVPLALVGGLAGVLGRSRG